MAARRLRPLYGLLVVASCVQPQAVPPEPAPPGGGTFVSASFDLTWTAALDHFAESGIPLATVDRASGRFRTERVTVAPSLAGEFADCGSTGAATNLAPYLAGSAVYSVAVVNEGSSSSVLVSAAWEARDPEAPFGCETRRVQEAEMQEAIKLAAEVNR